MKFSSITFFLLPLVLADCVIIAFTYPVQLNPGLEKRQIPPGRNNVLILREDGVYARSGTLDRLAFWKRPKTSNAKQTLSIGSQKTSKTSGLKKKWDNHVAKLGEKWHHAKVAVSPSKSQAVTQHPSHGFLRTSKPLPPLPVDLNKPLPLTPHMHTDDHDFVAVGHVKVHSYPKMEIHHVAPQSVAVEQWPGS